MVNGQINLRDAIKRQIDFETGGKQYKLSEKPAVLIVRFVMFHFFNVSIYFCIFAYVHALHLVPVDGISMNLALLSTTSPFLGLCSTLLYTSITTLTSS